MSLAMDKILASATPLMCGCPCHMTISLLAEYKVKHTVACCCDHRYVIPAECPTCGHADHQHH